jgi:3-hydroxybutyryl-CoA dehydrogenase
MDGQGRPLDVVGVVGAGTMGAGIAQLALEAGHEVLLHDVDEAAIERGRERIREGLARRAARLDLDPDSIDDWVEGRLEGLRDAHSLDALAGEAGVVLEAAVEDLDLKRTIFRVLDAAASGDVLLATNTSALSVGAIAAATSSPARVIGLHFFNPAPVMPLVEVVAPSGAAPGAVDRGTTLVESWGRTAVRTADSPGFIVNRVNRPFTLEALAMHEAGEASVEAVDTAVRAAGYPMGPFELMDLVGLDVNLAAARGVWEGFGRAERFRPSPVQEHLVEAGRLGRKAGVGFYRYDDGPPGPVDPVPDGTATVDGAAPLEASAIIERLRLAIVNEAWHALGDGVATEGDIDLALRLGAGHPDGPFAITASIGGPRAVLESLRRLAAFGSRFEPAPALISAAS